MKKNKAMLFASTLFLLVVVIVLSGFLIEKRSDEDVVLTINDHKVTTEEFNVFLQDSKALTIAHFQSQYDAEYNQDFWQTSFQGETPLEHLKNKALQQLKQYKVEQIMMLQEGVVEDISYKHFLQTLEEENAQRQQKLNNAEPIYGPKQYQALEFFRYSHAMNRQKLIDKMVLEARKQQTEEFFAAYYEKIKAAYFKKSNRFDYEQILVRKTEQSEQQFNELLQLVAAEQLSTEEAAQRVGLEMIVEQKHLELEAISKDDVFNMFLFESFNEREEGQFLELLPQDEQYDSTYRLTHIYDDGYAEYEAVKDAVPQYYAQELLEQKLQESMEQAKVTINEKVFNKISMD